MRVRVGSVVVVVGAVGEIVGRAPAASKGARGVLAAPRHRPTGTVAHEVVVPVSQVPPVAPLRVVEVGVETDILPRQGHLHRSARGDTQLRR